MKDQVPAAMPQCFENWCRRFDDVFSRQKQRQEFRVDLGGLLGESQRKNLSQLSTNTVDGSYNSLRHFLNHAPWDEVRLNNRRLEVMHQCRQTTPSKGFTLIVDDSGHRKSGTATDGIGRQYIGEIGKTDNGIVLLTTYLHDGVRRLPLDVALYQHASSLEQGKADPNFKKKPDLALDLVDQCLKRGYRPGVTVVDAGYGNNTPFLKQLESRNLTYVAAIAKNRQVSVQTSGDESAHKQGLEAVAQTLAAEQFTAVQLNLEQPRTVWVAVLPVHMPKLEGTRWVAIQLNASSFEQATEVDYFLTNASDNQVSATWVAQTYSARNWVEVFYREAKGWLGLSEYQVRDAVSMKRHWVLVFTAYTFILWHQLTGGFRRRWATKPLQTFAEALEAFRTAVEFRLVRWLNEHLDVFASHRAMSGYIWA
ncbi:MAG: IS701 family transposase [Chroococcidiopsidaceae cyanobacterium CP_BM_ER_R8_30]|nr:IS701 family transposase [Chroococcidiopsidaceae cyanobacterium CP_BM_ER_R8_30]